MAQVQGEATIIQAIVGQYMNMEKEAKYLSTDETGNSNRGETTRLNRQYAKRSEIHGSSGCATKPDINM